MWNKLGKKPTSVDDPQQIQVCSPIEITSGMLEIQTPKKSAPNGKSTMEMFVVMFNAAYN